MKWVARVVWGALLSTAAALGLTLSLGGTDYMPFHVAPAAVPALGAERGVLDAYMFLRVDYPDLSIEVPPTRPDLLNRVPIAAALAGAVERTGLHKLPGHLRVRYASARDVRLAGYAVPHNFFFSPDPLVVIEPQLDARARAITLQHELVHILVGETYGAVFGPINEGFAEWAQMPVYLSVETPVVNCTELANADFSNTALSGRGFSRLLFSIEESVAGITSARRLFDLLSRESEWTDDIWRTWLQHHWGCPGFVDQSGPTLQQLIDAQRAADISVAAGTLLAQPTPAPGRTTPASPYDLP